MTQRAKEPLPAKAPPLVRKKNKIKNCPFCGHFPQIEPWHGGAPTKRLISCSNEACEVGPMVCGETEKEAIRYWNHRKGGVK